MKNKVRLLEQNSFCRIVFRKNGTGLAQGPIFPIFVLFEFPAIFADPVRWSRAQIHALFPAIFLTPVRWSRAQIPLRYFPPFFAGALVEVVFGPTSLGLIGC
jgi:hypothetical protein